MFKDDLPKSGCRTLTDKQIEAIREYAKQTNFEDQREIDYFNGFVAGMCFLDVDEWESNYNTPFDEFFEDIYHNLYRNNYTPNN